MSKQIIYRSDLGNKNFENLLRCCAFNYDNPFVLSDNCWLEKEEQEQQKEDWEHDINIHNLINFDIQEMIEEAFLEGPCESTITEKPDSNKRKRNLRMKALPKSREKKMSLIKSYEKECKDAKRDNTDIYDIWLEKWYGRKVRRIQNIIEGVRWYYRWAKNGTSCSEGKRKVAAYEKKLKDAIKKLSEVRGRINSVEPDCPTDVKWAYRHQTPPRKDYDPRVRKKVVIVSDDLTRREIIQLSKKLNLKKVENIYYAENKNHSYSFFTLLSEKLEWIELVGEPELKNIDDSESVFSEVTYSNFSGKYPSLLDYDKSFDASYIKGEARKNTNWYKEEFLHLSEEDEYIQVETGYNFSNQVHEILERL